MSKKDAAITKALADLGLRKEPELSSEDEEKLKIAMNAELQYLQDIEDLFTQSQTKS